MLYKTVRTHMRSHKGSFFQLFIARGFARPGLWHLMTLKFDERLTVITWQQADSASVLGYIILIYIFVSYIVYII